MTLYYPPTENFVQKTLDVALNAGVTASATLNNVTGIQNKPGVMIIDRVNSRGVATPLLREVIAFSGTSGSTVTSLTRNVDGGNGDRDHAIGAIVEFGPDITWAQGLIDTFVTEHGTYGTHDATKVAMLAGTQTFTGQKSFDLQIPLKGIAAPSSPASGYVSLYAGTDGKIYKKTDAGVVSELGAGGTAAETFIIPGTLATGTDLAKTWVLPFDCKLQSATPYVKTAGTTNATTFDINLNGSTIATTKLSIASGATSGSNQALDNPTTTRTAGSLITIDVDSVSTNAPVEAYIVLFYERV